MANVIKHKRGSGSDPSASNLVIGELAIRTDNGKLFTKMDSGAIAEIAGGGSDIAINTLSSSSATGGGSATFNGSAYRFTLSSPPSVSAAQLLVSVNGVIQKPVAGTGQPSEGFSVDGNDIIFGDAPATGADFFILTFRSLGVSEPAANSVTNAKVASNAAIAGTKISPNFGSQNIVTTGNAGIGTTSPGYRLDIGDGTNGNDPPSGHQFRINAFGDYIFALQKQTTPSFSIRNNSTSVVHLNTQNSTRLALGVSTGNTSGSIEEHVSILSSGNVGIGTTSPGSLLHLSALGASDEPALRIFAENSRIFLRAAGSSGSFPTGGGGDDGELLFLGGDFRLGIGTASKNLIFVNGSGYQERMRINSSGNVGIGTSPDSGIKLHVQHNGEANMILEGNVNGQGGFLMLKNNSDNANTTMSIQNLDAGGQGTSEITFQNVSNANNEGFMMFKTRPSGGSMTERMRITADGYSKHSTNGNYDSYVKAVTAHEFRQYANSSTLWSSNTNSSQTWEILRADSARSATNAMNMITTTTGNLGDDQHRLIGNGDILCDGTAGAGAADYAEYFEWKDSNTLNEDRRGMTVVLVDGKVRKTTPSDSPDNVIGVVSANPVVVGDAQWRHWQSKYLRDDYGNYIYEDHNQIIWTDDNGVRHDYEDWNIPPGVTVPDIGVTTVTHDENGVKLQHQKLNPSYDESKTYIPRSERKEWNAIGMVGKLRVRKGQITGTRWIKIRDISDNVEEWLVR